MLKAKRNQTCFLRMLLPAPLSLGFSRLMGSVIPYLNTSWTAFKGMLLFVSKLGCPPPFSISENKGRSGSADGARSGQAVPAGASLPPHWPMACPPWLPLRFLLALGFSDPRSVSPNSSLPLAGASLWHQPRSVLLPALSQAGSRQPQCHHCVGGGEGQLGPGALGKGQQEKPGSSGGSALASSLLLSESLKSQLKQEIIHIK